MTRVLQGSVISSLSLKQLAKQLETAPSDSEPTQASPSGNQGDAKDRTEAIRGAAGFGRFGMVLNQVGSEEVAIKVIPICFDRKARKTKQLLDEIYYTKILSKCTCHFPKYRKTCILGYFVFIYMEFIPGETLEDVVERADKFSARDAIRCAVEILEALEFLLGEGLAHLDLKPDNVIVPPEGGLKLVDSGWVRRFGEPNNIGHCNVYCDPHRCIRGTRVIHAYDIYSFGKLLIYVLTGRHPAKNVALHDICSDTGLNNVLKMSLDQDPERRASAKDLLEILRPLIKVPEGEGQSVTGLALKGHPTIYGEDKVREWFTDNSPPNGVSLTQLDKVVSELTTKITSKSLGNV